MPFELFKQLQEKLSQINQSLSDGSVPETRINALKKMEQDLTQMISQVENRLEFEKTAEVKTLSNEDAESIKNSFAEFVNDCTEFKNNYPNEKANDQLSELMIPVSNLTLPLQWHAERLNDQTSLTDRLSDVTWTANLTKQSPNVIKEYKVDYAWQPGQKTIEESMALYKEKNKLFVQKLEEHFKAVTGTEAEDPFPELDYKMKMIAALETRQKSRGSLEFREKFQDVTTLCRSMTNAFKTAENEVDAYTYTNQEIYDRTGLVSMDIANVTGIIEHSQIGENAENRRAIRNAFKNIYPSTNNIGMTAEDMSIMNAASTPLEIWKDNIVENTKRSIAAGKLATKYPAVKELQDTMNAITKKLSDFLSDKGESPTTEDFGKIIDMYSKVIEEVPFVVDGEVNDFIRDTINNTDFINKMIAPGLDGKIAVFNQKLADKIGPLIEEQTRKFSEVKMSAVETCQNMEIVECLFENTRLVPEEQYKRAFSEALFNCKPYTQCHIEEYEREIKRFVNENRIVPEAEMQGFAIHENDYYDNYPRDEAKVKMREERVRQMAENTYLCKLIENERKINPEFTPERKAQILTDFKNNPEIKKLFALDVKIIAQTLIKPVDDPKRCAEKEQQILRMAYNKYPALAPKESEILTEKRFNNSDIFKDVANAIKQVNELPGKGIADYDNLYKSLQTYLKTHNSKPFHEYGQARFDAAAKMLLDVGMELYHNEKSTIKREDIIKDINVTMLRSNAFRAEVSLKAQGKMVMNEDPEGAYSLLLNNEKKISDSFEGLKNDMVTGKIKDDNQYEALNKAVDDILNDVPRHTPERNAQHEQPVAEQNGPSRSF